MNVPLATRSFADDVQAGARAMPRALGGPVVIIGGGPAGIRVAQELSRRGIDCTIFNAERWEPYNRVKLSSLLCGDAQVGQVVQSLRFQGPGKVAIYSGQSVIDIDREARAVTTSVGRVVPYAKLVICTGSRAHVPGIPGAELPGVVTFRDFDDVEALFARSFRSRQTVVIGGGLLGLEAARGMKSRGVETLVIEHEAHLMARQLDAAAGRLLASQIEGMGIAVRTGAQVASIAGNGRVEEIILKNEDRIPCDTVIVCTGIRANMEMARDVGLAVGRGIKVDETLRTSDADIYAVGECAEFEGHVFGLVGPAFEQAVVAAAHIAGEQRSYVRSSPSTKLKVVGTEVFSMGDVEQLEQRSDLTKHAFQSSDGGVYRRLVLRNGRLVGAIAVGDWNEINTLQEAIRNNQRLLPWQIWRFRTTGRVWPDRPPRSVREWPRAATVCNCTGVTRGQIGDAIALGATTLDDVKRDTGASTVCGSCKVHIGELLGAEPVREPVKAAGWHAGLSIAAAIAALITLAVPVVPMMQSIAQRGWRDLLWLDSIAKQTSGYVLLAICIVAAALSLRKRIKALSFGGFTGWRLVHLGIGAVGLAALFAHTGFRLGANFNGWLMATFLTLALAGAATGGMVALEHRLFGSADAAARARSLAFWVHLLAFWPLPLLLAVHIATVYFY